MSQASHTLYRKYRPKTFEDVIGQDAVIKTLQNSIEKQTLTHAYLFSGGRGTGKTSTARIFAHELGVSGQDLYEIDAASNNGVDYIRDLRENVSTIPFSSPYKVYLIDEAHMLSKAAFNALLKTLEEPPAHVIFILATTQKHDILDTIISRCQVFDFTLATQNQLEELITQVANKENRTIDSESISFIAQQGNGSYRDTLSILQKVFSSINKHITFEQIRNLFGTSSNSELVTLLKSIASSDTTKSIETFTQLVNQDRDTKSICKDLITLTRNIILIRYSRADKERLANELNSEQLTELEQATSVTSRTLQSLLNVYDSVLQTQLPQETFESFLFALDTR